MIPRDLSTALRVAHQLFKFASTTQVVGVAGVVGYLVRTDERKEYFVGNAEEFNDEVLETHSILFKCSLNYPGSKVLLLVGGDLFEYDPQIYIESESPWMRVKLSLSTGRPLN